MTIPSGRAIREALDLMIHTFCTDHLSCTPEALTDSQRAELLSYLESEIGKRHFRVLTTIKRKRTTAGGKR